MAHGIDGKIFLINSNPRYFQLLSNILCPSSNLKIL